MTLSVKAELYGGVLGHVPYPQDREQSQSPHLKHWEAMNKFLLEYR